MCLPKRLPHVFLLCVFVWALFLGSVRSAPVGGLHRKGVETPGLPAPGGNRTPMDGNPMDPATDRLPWHFPENTSLLDSLSSFPANMTQTEMHTVANYLLRFIPAKMANRTARVGDVDMSLADALLALETVLVHINETEFTMDDGRVIHRDSFFDADTAESRRDFAKVGFVGLNDAEVSAGVTGDSVSDGHTPDVTVSPVGKGVNWEVLAAVDVATRAVNKGDSLIDTSTAPVNKDGDLDDASTLVNKDDSLSHASTAPVTKDGDLDDTYTPVNKDDSVSHTSTTPVNKDGDLDGALLPVNKGDSLRNASTPPVNKDDDLDDALTAPVNKDDSLDDPLTTLGKNDSLDHTPTTSVNKDDSLDDTSTPPVNKDDSLDHASTTPLKKGDDFDKVLTPVNKDDSLHHTLTTNVNKDDSFDDASTTLNSDVNLDNVTTPVNKDDSLDNASSTPINKDDGLNNASSIPINKDDGLDNASTTPVNEDDSSANASSSPINKDDGLVNASTPPVKEDDSSANASSTPINKDDSLNITPTTPVNEDHNLVNASTPLNKDESLDIAPTTPVNEDHSSVSTSTPVNEDESLDNASTHTVNKDDFDVSSTPTVNKDDLDDVTTAVIKDNSLDNARAHFNKNGFDDTSTPAVTKDDNLDNSSLHTGNNAENAPISLQDVDIGITMEPKREGKVPVRRSADENAITTTLVLNRNKMHHGADTELLSTTSSTPTEASVSENVATAKDADATESSDARAVAAIDKEVSFLLTGDRNGEEGMVEAGEGKNELGRGVSDWESLYRGISASLDEIVSWADNETKLCQQVSELIDKLSEAMGANPQDRIATTMETETVRRESESAEASEAPVMHRSAANSSTLLPAEVTAAPALYSGDEVNVSVSPSNVAETQGRARKREILNKGDMTVDFEENGTASPINETMANATKQQLGRILDRTRRLLADLGLIAMPTEGTADVDAIVSSLTNSTAWVSLLNNTTAPELGLSREATDTLEGFRGDLEGLLAIYDAGDNVSADAGDRGRRAVGLVENQPESIAKSNESTTPEEDWQKFSNGLFANRDFDREYLLYDISSDTLPTWFSADWEGGEGEEGRPIAMPVREAHNVHSPPTLPTTPSRPERGAKATGLEQKYAEGDGESSDTNYLLTVTLPSFLGLLILVILCCVCMRASSMCCRIFEADVSHGGGTTLIEEEARSPAPTQYTGRSRRSMV